MGQKLKTAGDQWRFAEINLSSTHLRELNIPVDQPWNVSAKLRQSYLSRASVARLSHHFLI